MIKLTPSLTSFHGVKKNHSGARYLIPWPSQDELSYDEEFDLHYEIMKWCKENIQKFDADSSGIYLFEDDDAMAYRLRWE